MKLFLLKFFLLTYVVVLVLSGCVTSPVKQSKTIHHFIFTLSDIPVELQIRNAVKLADENENSNLTRDMRIDCIIFEPVAE